MRFETVVGQVPPQTRLQSHSDLESKGIIQPKGNEPDEEVKSGFHRVKKRG